jgi:AraC-like DNA-binding protein
VPVGKVMIFTQREQTRYGYPPEAVDVYRHRYLSIDPCVTVVPLFKRLRADFGSVLLMDRKGEACQRFDELFERFRERSFRDCYHELELITLLFTAMYREQVEDKRARSPLEYGQYLIQNQFRNLLTTESIAGRCGLSREHFVRSFRAMFGTSPGAELRRLRMENAAFLLRTTLRGVGDVARESGYAGSNAFCRAFRGYHGMSAMDYRSRCREVARS